MIGILCNRKSEKTIGRYLHNIFKNVAKEKRIPVIVFSMPNTNLLQRTVFGSLVSEEKISTVKVSLPMLIFNFAVQKRKSDIKKLRSLLEVENVTLINATNQFNQLQIMEMLLSNSKTKKFVLPFINYSREDAYTGISEKSSFILKPENRPSLSRIIYSKKVDYGFELYSLYGCSSCHKFDIQDTIHSIVHKGKWLLLKTPGLITYKNKIFVVRAYMQKKPDSEWEIVLKTIISHNETVNDNLAKKIDTASLQIIDCINCFIPDIGICFIDFVLDMRANPYLLNFGGWDDRLLSKKQNRSVRIKLCKNIMKYANVLSENGVFATLPGN
ncbi:MAG TPA: hypothetical protein GXX14_07080 [Clostridiaceae bacterium]|nr:hypothetical protein [Clostridiaceae bacterium]